MEFVIYFIYASIYLGLIATTFYIIGYNQDKKKVKPLFTDEELPKVTAVIPAWNEGKSIERTIRSMCDSDYPKNKLEVIVVDNNSKDDTLAIARKLKKKYKYLKVYTETKQGKGCALNKGISKATGEIIFSMDADTMVPPRSIREMTRYFKNPEVMSVTPSMLIHKPKGLLQRVQQAEYLFGLFIRKAFSSVNAIHVTPGAFSAYRKTFFDKYGGYDESNITEDLEMSLRIQYEGYSIEYSPESPAYTIAPNKFQPLLVQRRRWYTGLMRNTWKYRGIFHPKYGDLGVFVLPIAWISIFFSVFLINYMVIKILFEVQKELSFLVSINFDFTSMIGIGSYFFERVLFKIFMNPIIVFFLLFATVMGIYMKFATKKVGKVKKLPGTIVVYFLFFALLFGFWWTVSIIYVALNKKVKWR